MKLNRMLGVAAIAWAALASTLHAADPVKITVMPFGLNEYMANWVDEIKNHPAVKNGSVQLHVLDGRFDPGTQSNQIDTAIASKTDAIIFAPIDEAAATAPIIRAVAASIPVVTSVTTAKSDKLSADIVTNNVEGGRIIAAKLAEMLDGKGNVVLLEGPIGNSPQILRRQGIDEVLAKETGLKLLADKSANWSRAEGMQVMENWLSLYGDQINGVIAENDEMALGAIQAIQAKGLSAETIKVVAIDGINDGLRAVKVGKLFTLYKPSHEEGQGAVDLALRAVLGDGYKPQADFWDKQMEWKDGTAGKYDVPWVAVTSENVDSLLK